MSERPSVFYSRVFRCWVVTYPDRESQVYANWDRAIEQALAWSPS